MLDGAGVAPDRAAARLSRRDDAGLPGIRRLVVPLARGVKAGSAGGDARKQLASGGEFRGDQQRMLESIPRRQHLTAIQASAPEARYASAPPQPGVRDNAASLCLESGTPHGAASFRSSRDLHLAPARATRADLQGPGEALLPRRPGCASQPEARESTSACPAHRGRQPAMRAPRRRHAASSGARSRLATQSFRRACPHLAARLLQQGEAIISECLVICVQRRVVLRARQQFREIDQRPQVLCVDARTGCAPRNPASRQTCAQSVPSTATIDVRVSAARWRRCVECRLAHDEPSYSVPARVSRSTSASIWRTTASTPIGRTSSNVHEAPAYVA